MRKTIQKNNLLTDLSLHLTILDPIPWARFSVNFHSRSIFEKPAQRTFKSYVSDCASRLMLDTPPLASPISFSAHFFRNFPPSSKKFGDIDNLLKIIFDALNGIVFLDDSQIVSLISSKSQDSFQRAELYIRSMEG